MSAIASAAPVDVWFDDASRSPDIKPDTVRALAARLRHQLMAGDEPAPLLPASLRDDFYPRVVFLTVSDGARAGATHLGAGRGLMRAGEQALQAIRTTDRPRFDVKWARVDVVSTILLRERADLLRGSDYPPSLFGLALARQTPAALLPAQLLSQGVNHDRAGFDAKRFEAVMANQLGSAAAAQINPRDITVFSFTTRSCWIDMNGVAMLGPDAQPDAAISRARLRDAMTAAAGYLTRSVDGTGRLDFEYRPDLRASTSHYSLVAHLATVDAILDAYGRQPSPQLLEAIERAFVFADSAAATGTLSKALVVEGDLAKLGATALAAAAHIRLNDIRKPQHPAAARSHLQQLAAGIADMQADNGGFIHYRKVPDREPQSKYSSHFDGQAIYAMALLARAEPTDNWQARALKAGRFMMTSRDARAAPGQLPQDHWLVRGLAALPQANQDEALRGYMLKLAEGLMTSQHRAPQQAPWRGALGTPPTIGPTAVRMKAVLAAYPIARDHGQTELATRLLESAVLAGDYLLRQQITPADAVFYDDPRRILGAFHHGLTDPTIRADETAHALAALAALGRTLEQAKLPAIALPAAPPSGSEKVRVLDAAELSRWDE